MARIRTVKPEMFFDTELADISLAARYLFIGLLTQADRRGRLIDDARKIKAQIYPYEAQNCDKLLTELAQKFIIRYQVEGKRYIQIVNFEKHQRISGKESEYESIIPKCTDLSIEKQMGSTGEALGKHLGSTIEIPESQEGKGKEYRKGKELSEGFYRFWDLYPRHEGKQKALGSWQDLEPDEGLVADILEAVRLHSAKPQWKKQNGEFIPLPATWLNQRRWEDEGINFKEEEKPYEIPEFY